MVQIMVYMLRSGMSSLPIDVVQVTVDKYIHYHPKWARLF